MWIYIISVDLNIFINTILEPKTNWKDWLMAKYKITMKNGDTYTAKEVEDQGTFLMFKESGLFGGKETQIKMSDVLKIEAPKKYAGRIIGSLTILVLSGGTMF